ncbi:MAG: hypothetical protein AB7W16_27590 [Candidatus Obscuribacterales bacterium]
MEEEEERDRSLKKLLDIVLWRDLWRICRKPLITLFVFGNFGLIFLCFQMDNILADELLKPFKGYFLFFGLEQRYNVFAPTPRRTNLNVIAQVTYQDGSTRIFDFPRMDRLSLLEKLRKERWRKFLNDNIASRRFPYLYNDVALWAARQSDIYRDNRPVLVTLLSFVSDIPTLSMSGILQEHARNLANTEKTKKDDPNIEDARRSADPDATRNQYGNVLQPPNFDLQVLTVYEVKEGDLP